MQGCQLRLAVEPVPGLALPRRRAVREHPRGVLLDALEQRLGAERTRRARRSTGCRRPQRGALRSSRRRRGARTRPRGRRQTPDACGSRRARGRHRARSSRAPRPRRRSPARSRIRPTATIDSPRQRMYASSITSTARRSAPRAGAPRAGRGVATWARSRRSRAPTVSSTRRTSASTGRARARQPPPPGSPRRGAVRRPSRGRS